MKRKHQIAAAIDYLNVINFGCATETELRGALMATARSRMGSPSKHLIHVHPRHQR